MRINEHTEFPPRECPSCATRIPGNSNRCPLCGYEFPHPSGTRKNLKLWGGLLMLFLFAWLAFGLSRCVRF